MKSIPFVKKLLLSLIRTYCSVQSLQPVFSPPHLLLSAKLFASNSLPSLCSHLSCLIFYPFILEIMAAALVGGAFLSSFLNVLFDRLSSPEIANLIRGKKLDKKLLQRLENTLYAVQAVLNDAEMKQVRDAGVKKWLDNLRDAVYVADDLLDEVATKAATEKEVSSSLLSGFLKLQDRDREMVNKLEDITDILGSILKLKDSLGLKEIARENLSWRAPSTSLVEETTIYGRDQDKEAILKLLLDDNSDGKVSVIPIIGMGGVGKTTLAQLLYNDDGLKQKFDLKAWVCVSEEFEILKITKTILEAVTSGTSDLKDLNLLQLTLKEKLAGKKFFMVLDDVWNEDYVNWSNLQTPFQCGSKGSKILVTTRSKKVASVVQTSSAYHLNQLSDEDCWLVFANHACLLSKSNGGATLENIGKKIVKRCDGLPLAAQTLGGLLRTKCDIKDWNTILNSYIWELPEEESKIIPALRISYHYLPSHLKCCFGYCSLYPKDYEFNKDKLILLWMAEDLLKPTNRGKTLEEVGNEYFDDLASRSFFQHVNTSEGRYVMHDLMHDLATSIGGEFYLRLEELGSAAETSTRTRHLSYSMFSHPISKNFEAFGRARSLRTLLPTSFKYVPFSLGNTIPMILSKLKHLRVLSFNDFRDLDGLPHSIGKLIHLRYLDLSETSIETLPESLCNLYNLQTLKLRHCESLTMLPTGIHNLINLRHLDLKGTVSLTEMPSGMSKLKHLQLLSCFAVGKREENGIKELGVLSNLHGSLDIVNLENVRNSGEAFDARMMDKKHINSLCLNWYFDSDCPDSSAEKDILDKLQPHKSLKSLSIGGYKGTRFPDWVGHSSYTNMTYLHLSNCSNCCMLPPLGQLSSLKFLKIVNFRGLECIGAEFYKNVDEHHSCLAMPFPSLEFLYFSGIPCWKVWHQFESDAFLQLKQLRISDCPELTGDLPNHLPALETLVIWKCQQLACPLPRAPVARDVHIYESDKVVMQELPLSLRSLSIEGCQVGKAITNAHSTCLQSLAISHCSSAIVFPEGCLPASVKELRIWDCRELEFPTQQRHELLDSLDIYNSCDSLISFPLDNFPNLKTLRISNCEKLESLSLSQSQDATLLHLEINNCPKLESLPFRMNTLLPELKSLSIGDCLNIDSFPEGGLPRALEIKNNEKLILNGLASMDLHIESLSIRGRCESVKSFPKEGLLPQLASLTYLHLRGLSNLETLDCKGLLHLTSLQHLSIWHCHKLKNLAGERLPASLIKLEIVGSLLLEERCRMKHPEIWPKIAHIRGIEVNYRWIQW